MSDPFSSLDNDRLEDFKPKNTTMSKADRAAVRTVVAEAGFTQRANMAQVRSRRKTSTDEMKLQTLRVRVEDWNKFAAVCEEQRLPAWVVFRQLLE